MIRSSEFKNLRSTSSAYYKTLLVVPIIDTATPLTGRLRPFPPAYANVRWWSYPAIMAPLHRGVLRHTVSPSPIEPRRVPLAQVERGGGGGGGGGTSIVAPYTYHGDCLCWLMATYAAHTSHYEAVLGGLTASRPVT